MTSPDLYGNEEETVHRHTCRKNTIFVLPLSQIFLVLGNITKGYNLISPLACYSLLWQIPGLFQLKISRLRVHQDRGSRMNKAVHGTICLHTGK